MDSSQHFSIILKTPSGKKEPSKKRREERKKKKRKGKERKEKKRKEKKRKEKAKCSFTFFMPLVLARKQVCV